MTIADRIERIFKERNLKPADVARQLNVLPQTVNGWKKKGSISIANLIAFSRLTGYSVEWIALGEGSGIGEIREVAAHYNLTNAPNISILKDELEKISCKSDINAVEFRILKAVLNDIRNHM